MRAGGTDAAAAWAIIYSVLATAGSLPAAVRGLREAVGRSDVLDADRRPSTAGDTDATGST